MKLLMPPFCTQEATGLTRNWLEQAKACYAFPGLDCDACIPLALDSSSWEMGSSFGGARSTLVLGSNLPDILVDYERGVSVEVHGRN